MNKYRPRNGLIKGWQLGLDKDKEYIAVPEKKRTEDVSVEVNKKFMIIKKEEKPVMIKQFPDKFGRGFNYTLHYFEFNETQLSLTS